jgi:alpha-tubulin suppressor-like RCC1 family protein
VVGINTATGVAVGNSLSCAVLADGTAKCWGYNGYGGLGDGSYTESHVPVSVSGVNTATAITAGYYHACALLSDGTARCWGYAALGDGSGGSSNIPVTVSDLRIRWNAGFFANAADLAIGGSHVCAVIAGGAVQCWGSNQEGQLGLGSTVGPESCLGTPGISCSTMPEPVTGIGAVADVAAGSGHTCAALSNGTVQCWGGNDDGQLGNGTTTRSSSPVSVSGISSALKMGAGSAHTCAALSDHSVQCWGDNFRGELGTDPASGPEWCGGYPSLPCSMSPVPVNGITTAADVTAGNAFSCARLSDGSVKCWGHNDRGQLGNGFTTGSYAPVSVSGISNAAAIAAGSQHTCAVLLDDTVKCWGYNGSGQLGSDNSGPESCDANPSVPCSKTPIAVAGINNAKAIAAGGHNTCVLLSNGSVQCWGSNQAGQLGNGLTTNSSAPVLVNGINDAVAIAAGGADTCAVLSTGWVKCWGGNVLGELGIATSDGPESCTIPAPNPLDPPITVSCSTNPVQVIQDTAATLVWSSSNLPVATINNRGMATGLGDGLSPITAALGPLSGSTLLSVGTVRLFLPIILRP